MFVLCIYLIFPLLLYSFNYLLFQCQLIVFHSVYSKVWLTLLLYLELRVRRAT